MYKSNGHQAANQASFEMIAPVDYDVPPEWELEDGVDYASKPRIARKHVWRGKPVETDVRLTGMDAVKMGKDKRPLGAFSTAKAESESYARYEIGDGSWDGNYAVLAGDNDLVIIDCDIHEDESGRIVGEDEFMSMCVAMSHTDPSIADIFHTMCVRTPSGGLHFYFRNTSGIPLTQWINAFPTRTGNGGKTCIDVKCAVNNYVLGPGSVNQRGGVYKAIDEYEIKPLPESLLALLIEHDNGRPRSTVSRNLGQSVVSDVEFDESALTVTQRKAMKRGLSIIESAEPGTRNDSLNTASYSIGAAGVAPEMAYEAVCQAARNAGLDEYEIEATAAHALEEGYAAYEEKYEEDVEQGDITDDVVAVPEAEGAEEDTPRFRYGFRRGDYLDNEHYFSDSEINKRIDSIFGEDYVYIAEKQGGNRPVAHVYVDGIYKQNTSSLVDEAIRDYMVADFERITVELDTIDLMTQEQRSKVASMQAAIDAASPEGRPVVAARYEPEMEAIKEQVKRRKSDMLKKVEKLQKSTTINQARRDFRDYHQVEINRFNKNFGMVVTLDGVVDLRTGIQHEHSRDFYETRKCEARYRPGLPMHPLLVTMLNALPDDCHEFWQEQVGKALTGYQASDNEFATQMHGDGRNGKSAWVTMMEIIGGDYVGRVAKEVLLGKGDFGLASIENRRCGIIEELPGDRIDVSVLKDLINSNTILINQKFEKAREIKNEASFFITSNVDPTIIETDAGTWRRILRVPFKKTFVSTDRETLEANQMYGDTRLAATAMEDTIRDNPDFADSFLTWAIDGAIAWMKRGRTGVEVPLSVQMATAEYRESNDILLDWMKERVEYDATRAASVDDCYRNFVEYTESMGRKAMSKQKWSQSLQRHEYFKTTGFEWARQSFNNTDCIPPMPGDWIGNDGRGNAIPNKTSGQQRMFRGMVLIGDEHQKSMLERSITNDEFGA